MAEETSVRNLSCTLLVPQELAITLSFLNVSASLKHSANFAQRRENLRQSGCSFLIVSPRAIFVEVVFPAGESNPN